MSVEEIQAIAGTQMKFLVSDQINTEVKLQNFRKIIDKLTLILFQRQDPQILILVPKIKQ